MPEFATHAERIATGVDPNITAESDRLADLAESVASRAQEGNLVADRAGHAAVAQVFATLALRAEVRAMRMQLADIGERKLARP